MAEIAGTIVGIVSLSIQTCQGLIWYIDGVKSAKSKAEQIFSETERLANLLELLDSTIGKLDATECVATDRTGITACADALRSIRKTAGQNGTSGSQSRVNFKTLGKRLAAPFKEADMKYKKEVINSIHMSLQTALHALQIDQRQRDTENINRLITQLARHNMSSMQDISDRHQELALITTSYHHEQQTLLQSNFVANEQNFESLRYGIMAVQSTLEPITSNMANLATLSQNASALTRLLDSISLSSAVTSRNASPRLTTLRRTYRRAHGRCTCHRDPVSRTFLRWPISIAYSSAFRHNNNCPRATSQEVITDLRLELSICSFMLGQKFKIALEYSSNGSSMSIAPSLECIRFVTDDSPAFKLLRPLGWSSYVDMETYLVWLDDCASGLYQLFETRQITPYDRLLDGSTLLHHLCSAFGSLSRNYLKESPEHAHKYLSGWHKILMTIISYMPSQKNERNNWGQTCLDLMFIDISKQGQSTVSLLLEMDMQVTRHAFETFQFSPVADILFKDIPDPIQLTDDVSEGMLLILQHSKDGLQNFIEDSKVKKSTIWEDSFAMYQLATRVMWVEGCSIMHDAGMLLRDKNRGFGGMLRAAVWCGDAELLKFWLDVRRTADKTSLMLIGDLGEAYGQAAGSNDSALQLILPYLIQERLAIAELMQQHHVSIPCPWKPGTLLDTHAACALFALEEKGIGVPAFLHRVTRNVYFDMIDEGRFELYSTHAFQRLFDSGFRDVSTEEVSCDRVGPGLTPLLYLVAHRTRVSWRPICRDKSYYRFVEWFLERGASLEDRWDGSNTRVAHLLGMGLAGIQIIVPNLLKDNHFHTEILHASFSDDCTCLCSNRGCLPVTAFWKQRFHYTAGDRYETAEMIPDFPNMRSAEGTAIFTSVIDFLSDRIEPEICRWFVTEIIRLTLFSLLGLRHTCCNFANITSQIVEDTSISEVDFPIHQSAAYIRRVKKEDAYLSSLLEKLLPEFDAAFDVFEGTLPEFVDTQLLPRMEDVLQQLKEEDKAEFGEQRRKMGVRMYYDDEEEDGESSVDTDDDDSAQRTDEEDIDFEEE
ncbi:hypothetical protein T440DRAFT_427315 [Plenodomus tracheiphilus IPT5]|uniref:Fungal N-terminal domain-containing protein n=1 Tax=Plenodomus tracheiphilus IPT5 TaxID=1408161 RepID=A0A6A7B453_9PLEO|nr:hypothetical protein T440DRAFT_427315 [Plenodomus tracheiphilus IPT5]